VNLEVRVDDPRVAVTSIEPASIDVQLELLKSRQMDVHSDVLDAAPPGYTFRSPVVTPSQVTLTGPAVLVDQVNDVAADVYLRGSKAPIQRDVTVLARDAQGNLIQGITITPATVNVVVAVEQRVGFKDVSIRAVLKGAPAAGYWVSNITVNPSTATIVGSPDAMAKVAGFVETVPIDITGATADVSRRAVLSLPEGLSVLNNEGITVQVSITPILGGQTVHRKVTIQGLVRGLAATVSPDSVDVILSGPLPSLQALQPEDVQVSVDATGQTPGIYIVKPRVLQVPDPLKVQSIVPETVQVTVLALPPTATPNLPVTATLTSTITSTLAISPTVTPTR
jgi:YbbR domain-containing protein